MIAPEIEANEECNVANIDIQVTDLHTENGEYLIVLLIGRFSKLMDMVDLNSTKII